MGWWEAGARQSPPGRHPRSNMPKALFRSRQCPLDADGEGLEVSSHRPRDTPIGTAEMTDALGADDVGWEEDSQGEGETILPKSNLAPLPLEPPFQPMLLAGQKHWPRPGRANPRRLPRRTNPIIRISNIQVSNRKDDAANENDLPLVRRKRSRPPLQHPPNPRNERNRVCCL